MNKEIKSIYIHIPFCKSRCFYCDFYSSTFDNAELHNKYINSLFIEWDNLSISQQLKYSNILTIYIGGGTPNSLNNNNLIYLFNEIEKRKSKYSFDIIEYNIESNPDILTKEQINIFDQYNINRISLGIQSFNTKHRQTIGRIGDIKLIENKLLTLKKYYKNKLNLDLMIGLPNQSINDLENDLCRIINLNPEHLSVYILTPAEGTKLYDQLNNNKFTLPNDTISEYYLKTIDTLEEKGYQQYEVSNFSKGIDNQSKHNLNYWNNSYYLGLGASASSYYNNKRTTNIDDAIKYIEYISEDKSPIIDIDELDNEKKINEFIYLSLRVKTGISKSKLKGLVDKNKYLKIEKLIAAYTSQNYIIENETHYYLSKYGFLYIDRIAVELISLF